ncbi:MAG: hypothetical protein ACE37K_15680 [Planctomycetota bacterium]
MTENESEIDWADLCGKSTELDSYDYRNQDDEDDYVSATLYRTPDGRHFRFISATGMNTGWAGAADFGEWLVDGEEQTWKSFYP